MRTIDLLHVHLIEQVKVKAQKISIDLDDQSLSYAETYYYVQKIALALLKARNDLAIDNVIIYQLMERSIEIPLSMFAVFTIGGTYLALSPDDPDGRLSALIQETTLQTTTKEVQSSALVLVHGATRDRISFLSLANISLFPVDVAKELAYKDVNLVEVISDDLDHLSITNLNKDTSSFIICTSGSTGKFKAVEHTHGSEMHHVRALVEGGIFITSDNILQLASIKWALHHFEVINAITTGASLILLRPGGQLDINYLCKTMTDKQVSTLIASATMRRLLTDYITINEEKVTSMKYLRIFAMGGARVLGRQLVALASLLEKNSYKARILNHYGLAECCGLTAYNVDRNMLLSNNKTILDNNVALGQALPGRQLVLIDDKGQVITNENVTGVIYVNDSGVFKGYRGQPDITAKAKVTLLNVGPGLFMRTGDLAYYNDVGDLVYVGRDDFRVKIFGQLVAPEEIEQTVIRASKHVEACIVRIESDCYDDRNRDYSEYWSCHILAPTISSAYHAHFIRHLETYCRQNLSSSMLPAAWKIYDEFPYLSVGKIDRCGFPKLERTGTVILSVDKSIEFE
ncbi:unnamed protein product [Rotaria magnacalcarata]|uniref:AMP-dependent synthetase/ligase domain-containing protein n=2 Tax=Rotaria magnacalcarata TaxID=392030 RepID=A0A816T899_9BILA|nr:unnamed protein product [Rotaria magnacalcarata]